MAADKLILILILISTDPSCLAGLFLPSSRLIILTTWLLLIPFLKSPSQFVPIHLLPVVPTSNFDVTFHHILLLCFPLPSLLSFLLLIQGEVLFVKCYTNSWRKKTCFWLLWLQICQKQSWLSSFPKCLKSITREKSLQGVDHSRLLNCRATVPFIWAQFLTNTHLFSFSTIRNYVREGGIKYSVFCCCAWDMDSSSLWRQSNVQVY